MIQELFNENWLQITQDIPEPTHMKCHINSSNEKEQMIS